MFLFSTVEELSPFFAVLGPIVWSIGTELGLGTEVRLWSQFELWVFSTVIQESPIWSAIQTGNFSFLFVFCTNIQRGSWLSSWFCDSYNSGVCLPLRSYGKGTGRECMRVLDRIMEMGKEPAIFLWNFLPASAVNFFLRIPGKSEKVFARIFDEFLSATVMMTVPKIGKLCLRIYIPTLLLPITGPACSPSTRPSPDRPTFLWPLGENCFFVGKKIVTLNRREWTFTSKHV